MTVQEIIEAAGGELELAKRCETHQTTVQLWIKNGIPEKNKYWKIVIRAVRDKNKLEIDANDILEANYLLRS